MFIIRDAQLVPFEEQRRRRFEDELLREVDASDEPAASAARGSGRGFVQRAIALCAAHGIDGERDVARFVALLLRFGEGFERRPRFAVCRALLSNDGLGGSAKVAALESRLADEEP